MEINMIIINEECPNCKKMIEVSVGQQISFNGKLKWFRSTNCLYCGFAMEEDDYGFPPKIIRDTILKVEGEWQLIIDNAHFSTMKIAKVLKDSFNLEYEEAIQKSKSLTGVIHTGTGIEIKLLNKKFSEININSCPVARQNEEPNDSTE